MNFFEIETFLVERVKAQLDAEKQQSPENFLQRFFDAYAPLQNMEVNHDYSLPLTGEACALKYHLQRMDNLCVALDKVNAVAPILTFDQNNILDIGGGTGGSTMAILRWLSIHKDVNCKICLYEPSTSMRSTSEYLVPRFHELLDLKIKIPKIRSANLKQTALICQKNSLNLSLVVFCYTFWIQDKDDWPSTTEDVLRIAESVQSGGVMVFLTPNPSDQSKSSASQGKAEFMAHLRQELGLAGLVHHPINIRSGFRPGENSYVPSLPKPDTSRNPKKVRELLKILLDGKIEMTGKAVPYYAFSATIDAFVKP